MIQDIVYSLVFSDFVSYITRKLMPLQGFGVRFMGPDFGEGVPTQKRCSHADPRSRYRGRFLNEGPLKVLFYRVAVLYWGPTRDPNLKNDP